MIRVEASASSGPEGAARRGLEDRSLDDRGRDTGAGACAICWADSAWIHEGATPVVGGGLTGGRPRGAAIAWSGLKPVAKPYSVWTSPPCWVASACAIVERSRS